MNNKQTFIKAFECHIVDKPPVRVKVNGNFVKTISGKSGWQTVGHAKSALKHHLNNVVGYREMHELLGEGSSREQSEKWGLILEEMIREGTLEFC